MTISLTPEHRWECPNCVSTHVTNEARPHTPFHNCRGMKGLSTPFVPAGIKCKIESNEREDYINNEIVQTDGEGAPIMSVVTTREDGQDCAVYAPTAQIIGDSVSPSKGLSGRNVSVGAHSAAVKGE